MGQVFTCPECGKKVGEQEEWSLVATQSGVEIRAHAGLCALRAMNQYRQSPPKPAGGFARPKK